MKKILFMAVAAIAVLSGCSSDEEFANEANGIKKLVFTATMEGSEGTRATYDDTKKCAAWALDDKININGMLYSANSAGTTTTFKADGEDATGPYNAYFPASLYNNGTPTLPANINETWADGKFNMPMYAYSTTTELAFKNLCGVLKITVKNDQLASVKCITISSTNCATSGAFTVDATTNAAVLTQASKTANTVTVTYTDAVSTDATGKVFYIAIPAQTYKNLSIAVSDGTTTKVMTTKKDQDITVNRSSIYSITFDGKPTTGKAATSSIGDVNWVQLWGNGPKFAEYNVGVTDGKAESYGGYYRWGSSIDKDSSGPGAYKEGKSVLTGTDDTATNLWGNNWRMPTKAEFQGLIDNCVFEWTTVNSVNGCKFTGKGAYSSNSIFLPATGLCYGDHVYDQGGDGYGGYGYYRSSTPDDSDKAFNLFFNSGDSGDSGYALVSGDPRNHGYSVRAVLKEE